MTILAADDVLGVGEALLLGLLQGLTEFLPVSSSGHLALARSVLQVKFGHGVVLEVALHVGTALAIVVWYRVVLLRLARAPVDLVRGRFTPAGRELGLLVVGTLPAAAIGLLFKDDIERSFDSPVLVCACLMVTGGVLLLTSRLARTPGAGELGAISALLVGLAQACALLPGISRSGSTVAAALLLGIARPRAAEFSLLLGLVAVAGASVLEAPHLYRAAWGPGEGWAVALGVGASFAAGLLAIHWLLAVVRRGGLGLFGGYCLAVGGVGLAVLLAR